MIAWITAAVLAVAAVAPAWLYWRHALRAHGARRDAARAARRAHVEAWLQGPGIIRDFDEPDGDVTASSDDIDAEAYALWLAHRRRATS